MHRVFSLIFLQLPLNWFRLTCFYSHCLRITLHSYFEIKVKKKNSRELKQCSSFIWLALSWSCDCRGVGDPPSMHLGNRLIDINLIIYYWQRERWGGRERGLYLKWLPVSLPEVLISWLSTSCTLAGLGLRTDWCRRHKDKHDQQSRDRDTKEQISLRSTETSSLDFSRFSADRQTGSINKLLLVED